MHRHELIGVARKCQKRIKVLGIRHFDVRQLAVRAFDNLVAAKVRARGESNRHLGVGAAMHDQRRFALQIARAQDFSNALLNTPCIGAASRGEFAQTQRTGAVVVEHAASRYRCSVQQGAAYAVVVDDVDADRRRNAVADAERRCQRCRTGRHRCIGRSRSCCASGCKAEAAQIVLDAETSIAVGIGHRNGGRRERVVRRLQNGAFRLMPCGQQPGHGVSSLLSRGVPGNHAAGFKHTAAVGRNGRVDRVEDIGCG